MIIVKNILIMISIEISIIMIAYYYLNNHYHKPFEIENNEENYYYLSNKKIILKPGFKMETFDSENSSNKIKSKDISDLINNL